MIGTQMSQNDSLDCLIDNVDEAIVKFLTIISALFILETFLK